MVPIFITPAPSFKGPVSYTLDLMIEILRDSIWTFVGTLFALAAIVVAIAIYYGQRERKRLLVETLARVPLLALGKRGIDGLQLTFRGEPLTEASVLLVRVSCVGNRPIVAIDYDSPISFSFLGNAQVLVADVVSTDPAGVPIAIDAASNSATLTRHMLNPGDTVTCRMLIKESDGKFDVSGRIAGVKRIERSRSVSILPAIATMVALAVTISAFLLSPSPKSLTLADLRPEELPYVIAMLVGLITLLIGGTADLKSRLRKAQEQRLLIGHDEV